MSAEMKENTGPVIGIRHLQAVLLFLAICVNFIARNTVSVALVAMTDAANANPDFPEYKWSEAERSYILSSFYWGYVVTQFPAGILVSRYGAKTMLLYPTIATAVCSALMPNFISWGGWAAFCVLRVIMGLSQGLIVPAIFAHVAKWSPPKDRNILGSIAYTGNACGLLLAMAISGLIAESALGWPGIFYVTAGVCFAWCLLWLLLAADNAPSSRLVSQAERDYIERSMKREDGFHKQKIPLPWRAVLTSAPFYALVVVSSAQGWTASMTNQQTPAYLHGVLEMDIKSNALFSALPYLAMWATSYVYLIIADVIMSRKWMTLGVMRKTINTMASWGPAATLIGIGFLTKDQSAWAVALFTLKSALSSGTGIGSILNVIDLSPNHSGLLMGITNAFATVFSLLTSLVVGAIVDDTTSRSQWQIIFGLTAAVYFVGNLVYIIWGSTDQQPWDAADYLKPVDVERTVDKSSMTEAELEKQKEALKALETKSD